MNVSFSEQKHCWTSNATCDTWRISHVKHQISISGRYSLNTKSWLWSVSLKHGIKARQNNGDVWWKSKQSLEEVNKKKEEGRAATMAVEMESYSLMESALHPGINLSNYRQQAFPPKPIRKSWVPNFYDSPTFKNGNWQCLTFTREKAKYWYWIKSKVIQSSLK